MIEVAIMIEGQNGLTWERWQRIARAVEEFGFIGLYRSDHYTNATPPDKESLELWILVEGQYAESKEEAVGSGLGQQTLRIRLCFCW